jgi:predicted alpha/beta-hydrolase family hydrolase
MRTLILTHGAGGNRNAALLVALANLFEGAAGGVKVIRYDLPFRQKRPQGPPRPADAALDRAGLREQVMMVDRATGPVFLGGVSYGGRQASMLVSEEPELVDGLLLLSYPLHPPGKPDQLRTAHLPNIRTPVLFVHGSRDPFGSLDEIQLAMNLIPGRTRLVPIQGAGHDLKGAAPAVIAAFREFFA